MCNKAVDNYPHVSELFSVCFMTQEMWDKVVNTNSSTIEVIPEGYKSKKKIEFFLAFFIPMINIKLKKFAKE